MNASSDRWLQRLQTFTTAHRRGIIATALSLLGGFGVTAVAIAPLAPDAALLPQRLVTEDIALQGLSQQADALAALDLQLLRNDITRGTDSAESLFARLGVRDAAAAAFLRSDPLARKLVGGRGGKMVQVQTDQDGSLQRLVARYPAERSEQAKTHFTRLTLQREAGRWVSKIETAALSAQVRMGSGTIRSSLFAATDEALLPDGVASQLADLFATDIDFHRELRKGDTFSVLYEALTADGDVIAWGEGAGRVLAAEFVNNGKAYHAVWFDGQGSAKSGYFGLNGQSKRRLFLASPMEFSRVTSGFAMRLHPIMKSWRAHLGVDYGAPIGTAVRSVGDGVVDFAGWQNGYGNVVQLKHGGERSTVYAHLSRIDVKKGQRIEQGQRVGAVGMTGWSTGPHLHFEFRINGRHQDPVQVAKSSEPVTLDPNARGRFAELAKTMQSQLQVADTLASGRGRFE